MFEASVDRVKGGTLAVLGCGVSLLALASPYIWEETHFRDDWRLLLCGTDSKQLAHAENI